jgi:hypothetical protein
MWIGRQWIWALFVIVSCGTAAAQTGDPLPSWNKGDARTRIIAFVDAVTRKGDKDYVAPEARIAVFDNDGTLWSEQPMYVQMAFMLDRVKTLAPQHPEWKNQQPYKAVLERDLKALAAQGEKGIGAPRPSTSRCSSCSIIFGQTVSRPTSCPAEAWISCGPGPSRRMGSRPSRLWAAQPDSSSG